mgnify:CR=1 FL=1
MKHTLFTIILLLLTFIIVKSQRNIFLIPRHIVLELPDLEIMPRQNATSVFKTNNDVITTYMVVNIV